MQQNISNNNSVVTSGLDTGRSSKIHKILSRKTLAALLGVMVLLLAGALIRLHFQDQSFNETQFTAKVDSYKASGNYKGLIKYISSLPQNKQTYSELIGAYTIQGNHEAALKTYKSLIDKYGNNGNTAAGAAAAAEAAHQYTEAVYYYRQALSYEKAKPAYPMQSANEQFYSDKISSIESRLK